MKKTVLSLCVAAAVASGGSIASAVDYTIVDLPNVVIAAGSFHSGSFNLLATGYDPSTEHIIAASALFSLSDVTATSLFNPGGPELVTVELEGSFFGSAQNFSSTVIAGAILNLTLLDDNILGYTITSDVSSTVATKLEIAALGFSTAPGAPQPSSVPDGGATLALLGLSLAALGAWARRFRA